MDTSGQRENVLYPGTFSSREQRNIKLKGVNNWNKLKRNKLKEKKTDKFYHKTQLFNG